MSDIMRPVPFGELINRMTGELRNHGSVFGLSRERFYHDDGKRSLSLFGREIHTPVGPAAGPHTQLAQNIIASWLEGGRFIELKTVQEKDDFEATGAVRKPCIDSADEGYNVEWSTEFTLSKAWNEYCKAYVILSMLDAMAGRGRSFVFNMSVGYTLKGIRGEKMRKFIDSALDARRDSRFGKYLEEAEEMLRGGCFSGTPWEGKEKEIAGFTADIDPRMVNNVTISTMHGCRPEEIEAICGYMLREKRVHTYVKLNPTLLGYDAVRKILDGNGFTSIHLRRETFEKDLQMGDALSMLRRLSDLAVREKRVFGVKLTNTLASVNDRGRLSGEEMYMSGRALLPISASVALAISREFDGRLPISYSGGVTIFSAKELFECGLHPLTLATDMLHPGGYGRMAQIARALEESDGWEMKEIDVRKLEALVGKVTGGGYKPVVKAFHEGTVKIDRTLPLTDCFVAPCTMACPIHQPIPEYVQLCGEGQYADALALIYSGNPLPGITCTICDHPCQMSCSRVDYEGAVQIREMKKIALERGWKEFRSEWEGVSGKTGVRAAVIGSGPAGLAAAFFLARRGFDTTVFEKEKEAGGVVKHVIPDFRIPSSVVEGDIEFIKAHGVAFRYNVAMDDVSVSTLRKEGYKYLFYAIGAEKARSLGLEGDSILPALSFLASLRRDPSSVKLGRHVVVVGGGNTAMDSARAAKRCAGVESVTIVYRRTEAEMPAAREELEACLSEGIAVTFLATPVSLERGAVTLAKMKSGELDKSGRRRPVDSGERFSLPCDTLIEAIGEKVDEEALLALGIPVTKRGRADVEGKTKKAADGLYVIGDAESGPATVARAIASARAAVDDAIVSALAAGEEAIDAENGEEERHHGGNCSCGCHDEDEEEDEVTEEELEELEREEEEYFALLEEKKMTMRESVGKESPDFASVEASRCMECSYLCAKCVDVCPNRANVAIDVRDSGLFYNPFQILHLDAYCNECGNCETFCPYSGGPYRRKFTLFSTEEDFEKSENSGFCRSGDGLLIREDGKVYHAEFDGEGNLAGDEGVSDESAALIRQVFETYAYLLGPVEDEEEV